MFFVASIHITPLMVTVSQANSSENDSASSDNTMAATHRHNEWLPREMRSASAQSEVWLPQEMRSASAQTAVAQSNLVDIDGGTDIDANSAWDHMWNHDWEQVE